LDYINYLTTFISVAEHQNFSKAAFELNVNVSTVSKHVSTLEKYLEVRLFERTTRRIKLTAEGELYLSEAVSILDKISSSKRTVRNVNGALDVTLNICVPLPFGQGLILTSMIDYAKNNPKVTLNIIDMQSKVDLFTTVSSGVVDLVLTDIEYRETGLIREPLISFRRQVFASPSYIQRLGAPEKVQDLVEHNCLVNTRNSPDSIWSFDGKSIQVVGNYHTSSPSQTIAAAKAGLGLIWTSSSIIKEELERGELIPIKLDYAGIESHFLAYHRPVNVGHPIRVFVDYLKASLNSDPVT